MKSFAGGFDCQIDIGRIGLRDLGDHFAGRGIDGLKCLAGNTVTHLLSIRILVCLIGVWSLGVRLER